MNFNPEEAYRKASRENSRERMIVENLPYVRKILSKLTTGLPAHVDRDGLESAGIVGLVEAANSYDPTRGVAFKTYAYPRIHGAIVDELRKNSPVSQQMLAHLSRVRDAYQQLAPPVLPEDLARQTGLSLAQVQDALEASRFLAPQSWNDLHCVLHSSWRESPEQPGEKLEQEEVKRILAKCIERLPERNRLVLTMYYSEDLTLAEIGAVLDYSESYVSRLLSEATFSLKEFYRKETE
jgi:RNA polymerase sigma factor for flagellar operon FliA